MTQTFRLAPNTKYQGIACTAFFLAMVIASASLFFLDDPVQSGFKGKNAAAAMGVIGVLLYGSMLVVSLYGWAAYYVERFTVDGTTLSLRTMMQRRRFDVGELQSLHWRRGRLVFRTSDSTTRLDLSDYSRADRLQIIRALRKLVPTQSQDGWPMFCHKVALPLRDNQSSLLRSEPNAKRTTITRKRYDRALAVALPASIALALALGLGMHLWQFAVLPFVLIAFWLLLRSSVPAAGRVEARSTSPSFKRGLLIGGGGAAVAMLLMVGLQSLGVEDSTACNAGLVALLPTFPTMLFFIHKSDKERRAADERAAELAPSEWERGESTTA